MLFLDYNDRVAMINRGDYLKVKYCIPVFFAVILFSQFSRGVKLVNFSLPDVPTNWGNQWSWTMDNIMKSQHKYIAAAISEGIIKLMND